MELTKAVVDVLVERQEQIDKGYTRDHDDEHKPHVILSYGRIGEDFTRDDLVRAAACTLAAIERIDRAEARGEHWWA